MQTTESGRRGAQSGGICAPGLTDDLMERAMTAFMKRAELASILGTDKVALEGADRELCHCIKALRRHADTYVFE
jgi:hypothetical protein